MRNGSIRVLLVEDHAAFRQSLAVVFGLEPDLCVIGQAGTLAEARLRLVGVDVAVVDLALPDGDGTELIHELHAANPRARTLILTESAAQLDVARAVEAGATGILHKSATLAEIIAAVRRVWAGEVLLEPKEILALLQLVNRQRAEERVARRALDDLTSREREVLQSLAEGLSDKDIARRLTVSTQTVHTHMANLLRKLGVDSRLQALILALRHGAVTLRDDRRPGPR